MNTVEFQPGFRLSRSDVGIIVLGILGSFGASTIAWHISFIVFFVIGHFFLFCNVFRVSRIPELIWAGVFLVLSMLTIKTGIPGWFITTVGSLILSVTIIIREIRLPSYHGAWWLRFNPDLRIWWEANKT